MALPREPPPEEVDSLTWGIPSLRRDRAQFSGSPYSHGRNAIFRKDGKEAVLMTENATIPGERC